jgi:hypothetical protein
MPLFLSLLHLRESRALLKDFNDFSEASHGEFARDMSKNTKLAQTIKQDLDYIFKHTRYADMH